MSDQVAIVGAGLVGSLLALVLREAGYRVTVYEGREDSRAHVSHDAGRSINLVATARGLRALKALAPGILERLLALGVPVYGRVIHPAGGGEAVFQPYGKDDSECNYSLSRRAINDFLLAEADAAGVDFRFGHRLSGVQVPEGGAGPTRLTFDTNRGTALAACFGPVLAADGGGSATRRALAAAGATAATEERLDCGYKECTLPAALSGDLDPRGLHIWPRGTHFLMALADRGGGFTGTFYLANEGPESFAALEAAGVEGAAQWLAAHYADALPYLGGAVEAARQLIERPLGFLGTVRAQSWCVGGRVALIGDAAHAIVPFFGQGMNCGFEDVDCLRDCLRTHASPAAALQAFATERKPHADAIAQMALENYVEMMRSTGDPVFRKRKAVESALERSELGARFRSRYAMVCYGGGRSRGAIGYAHALQLGAVQWAIVSELADALPGDDPETFDRARAAQLLDEQLAPLQHQLGVDLKTIAH